MYQYIKSTTITSLDDALVELITNCTDAYRNTDFENKIIKFKIDKQNKKVLIIDNAIGLNATSMEECFLTVGNYTSNELNRGHFSRGAKDISSLGNVLFTAIKDNKISQVEILTNGKGALLISDREVTEEERNQFEIPENGLNVCLTIDFDNILEEFNIEEFPYHYALRDLLVDTSINLEYTNINDNMVKRLTYTYPENEKVIEVEYLVPYYGVNAKFVCYMVTDNEIKSSSNFRYNENGFLVSSNTTVYENGFLHNGHILRNPHINKLYGRIECDHIHELLQDYEKNGPSVKNPHPIIEPSRLNGLSRNHPFVKHLMRLPVERVLYILSEIEYESKSKIDNNKLNQVFGSLIDLQLLGNEIFSKLNIELISDFKLDKLFNKHLNQKFLSENDELKFSKKRIRDRKSNIKKKAKENLYDAARLSIDFVDETINGKYEAYATNQGISIKIPMNHSVIKRYLTKSGSEVTGLDDTRVRIAIADVITEAFSKILTDNDLGDRNLDELTTGEVLNLMSSTYDEYYNIFEEKVYDIVLSD